MKFLAGFNCFESQNQAKGIPLMAKEMTEKEEVMSTQ